MKNMFKIIYSRIRDKEKKFRKLLMVEYGSIDLDELEDLKERNPDIKIIVYRNGAARPELIDIDM